MGPKLMANPAKGGRKCGLEPVPMEQVDSEPADGTLPGD